jgi:DHA2 family multidrug resistance protein
MVMFFVPVTGLAIASVDPAETANAAGLSNFMRTLAGAFATSLIQTGWSDAQRRNQTELAGAMTHAGGVLDNLIAGGVSPEGAVAGLTNLMEGQSLMLATIDMFGVIALVFLVAATLIWLAPRPKGPIDTSGAH